MTLPGFRRSGLDSFEIAEAIGVHYTSIWRWRNCISPVPISHVEALATVIGCTHGELRPDLAAMFDPQFKATTL